MLANFKGWLKGTSSMQYLAQCLQGANAFIFLLHLQSTIIDPYWDMCGD